MCQNDIIEQPYFSIIIPTKNRTDDLEALLASIATSSFRSFEVLVVDQNQDERLDDICLAYSQIIPLRQLKVDFKGASRARNYGARLAKGHVLNFPDDDCEYFENLLCNAHRLIHGKDLSCLTGSCVNREGRLSATKFHDGDLYLSVRSMWGRVIEATIFIRKSVFHEVGGFDERFGVGSDFGADEGPELFVRIFKIVPAPKVYYCSDIRFYHPDKLTIYDEEAQKRGFNYSRGSGALFRKWPKEVFGFSCIWILKSFLGSLIYFGGKRRYYWFRVLGFIEGVREYNKHRFK